MSQNKNDLLKHLAEQISFLVGSSRAYDEGNIAEARRLAATTRLLLHDTKSSQSLLGQLGGKSKLRFWDTASPPVPGNLLSHAGLTLMSNSNVEGRTQAIHSPRLVAPAFQEYGRRGFEKWWGDIVVVDQAKHQFSRRDLVLGLANQDGGAHVDENLREPYASLARESSLGWFSLSPGRASEPVRDVHLATMRQIAHEILLTLQESFPQEFKGVGVRPNKDRPEDGIFLTGASVLETPSSP